MKRIALLLCVIMMLSCFATSAFPSTANAETVSASTENEPASIDFESMEVGDIVYVGDIAIQKAPDDDDGPSGPVTRSTTEGFEVKSYGGNTSVDKVLNLNSTYRYFCIYIKNTGSNTISVTIGNNSSTQSNNFHEIPTGNYYIWSTNQWAAQSHDVSFSSINGMYGSAKAMLCSTLAEAENHN